MEVVIRSFRDNRNMVVDELDIDDSLFERAVLLRNEDETLTFRAKARTGETVEHHLEPTERMYRGVEEIEGGIDRIHDDLSNALMGLGFTIEPSHMTVIGDHEDDTGDESVPTPDERGE